jgi:hypothetical protein
MEYFEDEIKQDNSPDSSEFEEKVQIEEPVIQEKEDKLNENIVSKPKPETIEIQAKNKVLPYVEPQENKYWHFKFNDINQNQLTTLLENIPGYIFTVTYGIPQNSPDILLSTENEIVGKIHLLLHDRRDRGVKNKYYIKLYFYDFKNQDIYETVKNVLVDFFENFKPIRKVHSSSLKRVNKHRTYKKKKQTNKKRTIRRK